MIMKFPIRQAIAALLCAALVGPAVAEESGIRIVRVGFFQSEGYHEQGQDGRLSGYGYEYLQNLRKYIGWDFEYVGYDKSWQEMLDMLERGEIDLVTSATKTPEREKKFSFSHNPIGSAAVLMTVKAGSSRYLPGDYRNWNGIRVGLLRGNTKNDCFAAFAREKGFRYVPVWFDGEKQMEAALQEGSNVDALVTGSLRRIRHEWILEQLDAQPFYAIVRKGDGALLNELDRAMMRLQLDSPALPDRLHHKYYSNVLNPEVLFTASERAFIRNANASKREFRVLINPDRPPFSSFRDGELCGIFREIADKISQRSGLVFEFVRTADRHDYRRAAANGDIDLIFDLRHDYPNAEKLGYILTDPYFSAVISRLRQRNFSGKPRSVALIRDSDVASSAIQYGLDDMTPFYYDSNQEVIEAVRSGRQDLALVYTRTAEKAIMEDLFGTLEDEVVGGLATPYAIGVNKHCDPQLVAILDKTLRSLAKTDIDKLVMEQMVIPQRPYTLSGLLMTRPLLSFGVLGLVLLGVLIFVGLFWMQRRSLWRYGNIVSKLPLRFFVVDAQGNILAGSSGVRGQREVPERPRHLTDIPDRALQVLMEEKVREVILSGKRHTVDFEFAGRKHSAEVSPLSEKIFSVPAAIWISMDTSELQAAREEALFNTERFRLTLQAIGDGVLVTDERGNLTMLNRVAEQLTGWTTEEALGRPHETVFHICNYLNDDPVVSPVRKVLSDGRMVTLANHTDLIARDDRRYHIADSAAPIRDRANKIIGTILVFRDVTKEYADRDRLRETLTSLEYASELTESAAFIFDPVTRKMTGSKILPRLWGIDDGGIAVSIRKWVCREDCKPMLRAWAKLAAGDTDIITVEYRSNRFGTVRHYRMRASVERSPRSTRFVGVIQDVTEIVLSTGKIKEQQALWEKVINAIPVMFFAKDADDSFRYVLCNRAFAAFLGKTPNQVVGKTDAELFSIPEETELFLEKDRMVMETVESESFEEDATDSKSVFHHIRTIKQPFIGPGGRKLLLGTSSDISELNRLIISEQINNEILARAVSEADFNRVLDNVAETLRKYINCDRIILAKCNNEGKLRLYREWLSGGIRSLKELDLEAHYRVWDSNLHIIEHNQALVIPDISRHEVTAGLLKDKNYQTTSLIVVPVFVDHKLWGALLASYATRKHSFTESDECVMRSCANVITLAEIRNRQQEAVERADFEKQMIFNNIRIPLWLHDGSGELLQVNNAVNKLSGIQAEELTTERNREIFCSGMTGRPIEEVIATGKLVRREVAFRNQEFIVTAEPVFNDDGKLIYIVKNAVDITELNALLENQKVVNFCLETLLSEDDMDRAILLALGEVCRYLGSSRGYIVQFDSEKKTMDCLVEYIVPGKEPIFSGIRNHPYSANPTWEERFRETPDIIIENMQEAAGTEVGSLWLEIIRRYRIQSVYTRRLMLDSKVWGYLGMVFEDQPHHFTEHDSRFIDSVAHFVELMLQRRRAQQQILDALKEAQDASRTKSYFLATMSHEIRTPLNAVIGFSELLKSGNLPKKEQAEYLDSIHLAGNSLLRLINDVLDLSKLEAEQTVFTPQPTDVGVLLHEIRAIFQYKVQQKKLFFRIDCPVDMPKFSLDSPRLRQVLLNLIGNAVKFTGHGGIILAVDYRLDGNGRGNLAIRISDTGIGITEEAQKKIFEPFVQGDSVRDTHVYGGTGLGLAISRRLIERMGGTIQLESEVGKGSVFIINLENIELVAMKTEPVAGNIGKASGDILRKRRVLLVDDVSINLKVLQAMLRKLDIECVCAESGKQTLEILDKDCNFDLIFSDLWMPEMDGAELAEKIHACPETVRLPIFAITADTQINSLKEFHGVLHKPITLEKLNQFFNEFEKSR